MQLKRDTDYAIRILLILAESAQNGKDSQGIELKTICEKTDVPRRIALRLCSLLSNTGFIGKRGSDGDMTYVPERSLLKKNLLEIIDAVEGQSNLFAVFDRRAEIYTRYGYVFEAVNDALANELNKITIQTILN